MLGKRRHIRVKGSYDVNWWILDGAAKGDGVISNISLTGMEMITRKDDLLLEGAILMVEAASHDEIVPLQSSKSRIIRSQIVSIDGKDMAQLGLEFIKEDNDAPNNDGYDVHDVIDISDKKKKV